METDQIDVESRTIRDVTLKRDDRSLVLQAFLISIRNSSIGLVFADKIRGFFAELARVYG